MTEMHSIDDKITSFSILGERRNFKSILKIATGAPNLISVEKLFPRFGDEWVNFVQRKKNNVFFLFCKTFRFDNDIYLIKRLYFFLAKQEFNLMKDDIFTDLTKVYLFLSKEKAFSF